MYDRDTIRASKRISNPGCYATSTQLLLAPLVEHLRPGADPTVFGLSGYSGGGTVSITEANGKPGSAPKVTPVSLQGGVKAYSLTDHIHEREAGYHLSRLTDRPDGVRVAFVPTVAGWFSGIVSTASVPLKGRYRASEIVEMFQERYRGERLVRIGKDVPMLGDVAEQHGWYAGGFQVHSGGERVVLVGGLDNLLKGAATQCVQVSIGSPREYG